MSTKTPLPTVNEKVTESVSRRGLFFLGLFSLSTCKNITGLPKKRRSSIAFCCLVRPDDRWLFHTWLVNRKQAYLLRQTRLC